MLVFIKFENSFANTLLFYINATSRGFIMRQFFFLEKPPVEPVLKGLLSIKTILGSGSHGICCTAVVIFLEVVFSKKNQEMGLLGIFEG